VRSDPGAIIIEFRRRTGKTQVAVARELGISVCHLKNVEHRRSGLGEATVRRLVCLLEAAGEVHLAKLVRLSDLDLLSIDRRMERLERRIELLERCHHSEVA
jgi:transcriptional regulator with XRE-family HTH domain